jgi:hypothetical protein
MASLVVAGENGGFGEVSMSMRRPSAKQGLFVEQRWLENDG